jgi:hypothetical protein
MRRLIIAGILVLSVLSVLSMTATAQTPPDLSTGKGLARVSLRRTDVRGFTRVDEFFDDVSAAVASYSISWLLPPGRYDSWVLNSLITWGSPEEAHGEWAHAVHDFSTDTNYQLNSQNYGALGFGDEDAATYSTSRDQERLSILFRHGSVVVAVTTDDPIGHGSWDVITAYANIVEARLEGQAIP